MSHGTEQHLEHAEHTGHDRDRDHPGSVQRQRPCVVLLDCLEHSFQQESGNDAEPRRDDDQHQDASEPHLVRSEQRADALQVRAAHLRVGRALRRRVRRVEEHAHRAQGTPRDDG